MDTLEIILLVVGVLAFVLSFVLPKRREELDEDTKKHAGEQMRDILDKEIDGVRFKIEEVVEETIEESSDDTKRVLEKLTNEKIMTINEYTGTVIEDINKNHKEVLFLYDMLNDKHINIRNTATEVEKTINEVVQKSKDIRISVQEAEKQVQQAEEKTKIAMESVEKSEEITNRAQRTVELTAQNMENELKRTVDEMVRARVEETLERTAVPLIQNKVDEILKDAALFMEDEKPKVAVGTNAKTERENTIAIQKEPKKSEKETEETTETEDIAAAATITENILEADENSIGYMEEQNDDVEVVLDKHPDAELMEGLKKALESTIEEEFVEGIAADAPKIIIEGESDEELQYYVLEPEERAAEKFVPKIPAKEENRLNMDESAAVWEDKEQNETKNDSRNSNEKILSLHTAGMSEVAIAKELGLGIGEVKLVIDLYKGK